jgi:DNA-binding response OmpR family regulator
VVPATSLAGARAALAAARVDGVLCDVMLGDGSGYELVRELRARPGDATPFLFVSALGDPAERARGIAAGADDYVAKPFTPHELVSRVARAIDRTARHRGALDRQRDALLMELHDGVCATLARARLLMDAGDASSLDAARGALARALDEARSSFALLEGDEIPLDDLGPDVRRAAAEACEAHGVAFRYRQDAPAGVVVSARSS